MKKLALHLYINGETPVSVEALHVLAAIGREYGQGEFALEVVDIQQDPDQAEAAGIIAIPTLIRSWPLPVTRLIGALTVRSRVLAGLGLHSLAAGQPGEQAAAGSSTSRYFRPLFLPAAGRALPN